MGAAGKHHSLPTKRSNPLIPSWAEFVRVTATRRDGVDPRRNQVYADNFVATDWAWIP